MENIKISQSKNVSAKEVVAESKKIWEKIRVLKEGADIGFIYEEHKDFASAYPIVLRYMQMNQFDKTAFKLYVHYLKNNPYHGHDEWLRAQAKYATILYGRLHPRDDYSRAIKCGEDVYLMLKQETVEFKQRADRAQKEFEVYDAEIKKERDREFIESVKRMVRSDNEATDHV